MSFENEQYEYIHEAYGSVELYAIYKVLIFFCIYNAASRYIDSLYALLYFQDSIFVIMFFS